MTRSFENGKETKPGDIEETGTKRKYWSRVVSPRFPFAPGRFVPGRFAPVNGSFHPDFQIIS